MHVRFWKALAGVPAVLLAASVLAQKPADADLIEAVRSGNAIRVQTLLSRGANPNARETLTTKPSAASGEAGGKAYKGDTALIIAIDRKDAAIAKLLLAKGAEPNGKGTAGFTALMRAAQDSYAMAKLLLDRGAKADVRNDYGDTAIVFAANVGEVKIMDLLLRHGANINGGAGWSPLMEAAYNGNLDAAKFLLTRHANPSYHPAGSMTPLECAVVQYQDEIADLIRKAGGKGRTRAQMKAEERPDPEIDTRNRAAHDTALKYASERAVTTEDIAVIETALVDMAHYGGRDLYSLGNSGHIDLLDRTLPFNQYGEEQMNSDLTESEAGQITLEMRQHLLHRNSEAVRLTSFKFSRPELALVNSRASNTWISTALPGFSGDRSRAVLRFWFGPTAHGASGTYLLAKKDGKWRVVWRRFTYYV